MRSVKRFVGWTVKGGVVLLVLLVVLSGLLLALGVRIELERLHAPLESVASRVLGRAVRLTGSVALVPTLSPTLEIGGLAIAKFPHKEDEWNKV